MITGAQIRGARRLLRWERLELAHKSNVPFAAIIRAESVAGEPAGITMAQANALQRTVEKAGVEFVEQNSGEPPGVQLRKERVGD